MDEDFLKLAIAKGNEIEAPYNFGAVVVKDGKVIGSDHAHVIEQNDPSAHSEVCAMRKAGQAIGNYNLEGCTLYASHEPCAMCFACAAWAGVERIVFVTPAIKSEIKYEFKEPNIIAMSGNLLRPMKVEMMELKRV